MAKSITICSQRRLAEYRATLGNQGHYILAKSLREATRKAEQMFGTEVKVKLFKKHKLMWMC